MKLVALRELLTHPPGTVFATTTGELHVFTEALPPRDFIYAPLAPTLERDEAPRLVWPSGTSRHGTYDENERFIVLDDDDVRHLIHALSRPIEFAEMSGETEPLVNEPVGN